MSVGARSTVVDNTIGVKERNMLNLSDYLAAICLPFGIIMMPAKTAEVVLYLIFVESMERHFGIELLAIRPSYFE